MNEGRKEIIQIVFVLIGLIFLIKLFSIQIVDDRYANLAEGIGASQGSAISGEGIDS